MLSALQFNAPLTGHHLTAEWMLYIQHIFSLVLGLAVRGSPDEFFRSVSLVVAVLGCKCPGQIVQTQIESRFIDRDDE